MRTQIVLGVLVALTALAAPANTAEVASAAPAPMTREFSAKLMVCGQCHGQNGVPVNPTIPVIWGQQEEYLAKQIHDFDEGARDAEVMKWMAEALSPAERAPTATFFAKKAWPAKRGATPAAATPRPNNMAVCEACHQLNFAGGLLVPRLAGQSYEYLVESMRRFADGERGNNAEMAAMMKAIAAPQREAMARYLSGL